MDPYTAALHHNQTTLQKLRKGDLVEFKRGLYSHWGVYIGNEEIVHLTGDENDGINANVNSGHFFTICGKRFNKAFVKRDKFWDVVLDSKAYKNNDKDQKLSPLSATEIVEAALSKIGEIGYNVLWNNCEHFAALCRYGQMKSDQAESFLKVLMTAAASIMVTAVSWAWLKGDPKQDEEDKTKKK